MAIFLSYSLFIQRFLNPLEKKDPDIRLPASKRPIGGLGIFMVKKMMDDVHYEYKDGRNILRIQKRL